MNSLTLQQSIVDEVDNRAADIIAAAFISLINERVSNRPHGCMCLYCKAHHEYTSFSILKKRHKHNMPRDWFTGMVTEAKKKRDNAAELLNISAEHIRLAKKIIGRSH